MNNSLKLDLEIIWSVLYPYILIIGLKEFLSYFFTNNKYFHLFIWTLNLSDVLANMFEVYIDFGNKRYSISSSEN